MSPKLVRVCGVDELDSDSHMQVRVPDLGALAVYHVDGRFYVTADSCTHMQASARRGGRARRARHSVLVAQREIR